MARQFVIVNNGMTGLRGHYYETAVSVAEEARRRGLRVCLAAHARCPAAGLPAWLTFVPLFRVDHFGTQVIGEEATAAAPPSRWQGMGQVVRRLVSPGIYLRLRAALRRLRTQFRPRPSATIALPSIAAVDSALLRQTADQLLVIEQECELRRVQMFHDDLVQLLRQVEAGPDDIVFLPTAHGREVLAVRHLLASGANLPEFHLELRHAVTASGQPSGSEDDYDILPYTWLHRIYFDAVHGYPPTERCRLYTDTEELAAEYASLACQPFAVLPIPFRAGLFPAPRPRAGEPATVLFLGDCRRDKGFHLLPGLVKALAGERVRFVLQATPHPSEQVALAGALAELRAYPAEKVRLIGDGTFLPPEEYYRELVDADIVLCPYRTERYRLCSSGVFSEAVAAGKVTVVPAGTWLARQQAAGSGETFQDARSLVEAVRRVCHDVPHYREGARRARERWLACHTPARLVDVLLQGRWSARAG